MSGPTAHVTVEPLSADGLDSFADVWIERREESGLSREAAQRAAADGRLARAVQRDGVVVFVATVEGLPVGYAWVYDQATSILLDAPSMAIEEIFVRPEWRRRGVARSLLLSVGSHAQRLGAEHITSSVPTHARDANRTFARLGFAPQTTRRVAPRACSCDACAAGSPRRWRTSCSTAAGRCAPASAARTPPSPRRSRRRTERLRTRRPRTGALRRARRGSCT